MRRALTRALCAGVVAAVGLSSGSASAQDLSIGYQFQRFSTAGDSLTTPLGINADLFLPIATHFGVVGQVDWSRKKESLTAFGTSFDSTVHFTGLAGGVRWNGTDGGPLIPFAHALLGLLHESFDSRTAGESSDSGSNTDPTFQLGGGVARSLGRWSVLGALDYRRISSEGEGVHDVRLVAGVRVALK